MYHHTAKLLFLITLLFCLFSSVLTNSFAHDNEYLIPLKNSTIINSSTQQSSISGDEKFRYEMAELLGERVGPDDSGNVYHAGGLSSFYTGPEKLFPGKGKYGYVYTFLPVIR